MGARKKAPLEKAPPEKNHVGERLSAEREEILTIWQNRVRQELPAAREQHKLALLNSIPQFLAKMSEALERGTQQTIERQAEAVGEKHGENRAELPDYSLQQVLLEYRILREVVFAVLESTGALKPEKRDILFDAFQRAMSGAASEFFRIKLFREQVQQLKSETYAKVLQDLQSITETAIAKSTDFQGLLHALLEQIKTIFNCDLVSIYVLADNQKEMILCASYGMEDDVRKGLRIPMGRGVPGAILAHKKGPLVIENRRTSHLEIVSSDPKWNEITSILGSRLYNEAQLGGTILIGTSQRRSFRDAEIKLFELIADRVGIAVFNSRVYEKAQADLNRFKVDDQLRAKILSQLAHEIRNPLTAAQMGAQLLSRRKYNPEMVSNLSENVAESVQRADKLLKDLLDVNRTLSGRALDLHFAPCDLNTVLMTSISSLETVYGNRFVYVGPEHPVQGNWSASELQRTFERLLKMCADWVPEGGPIAVSVTLLEKTVQVDLDVEGDKPIQDQQTLPLILARGIVRSHGGEITFLSEKKKTTTLRITLPYDSASC